MQLAADIGANVKSGVNKKINYLVVGDDGMKGKEEKASELIQGGCEIKIISESGFINLANTVSIEA